MKGRRFDKLCDDKKDRILDFLGTDDHFKYTPFQLMNKLSKVDQYGIVVQAGASLLHIDEMLENFDEAYAVRFRRFIGVPE